MNDRTALRVARETVHPANRADPDATRRHLDDLTKPPGSLGRLEDLALRLALIYGDPPRALKRRTVFVLAADHGVTRRGVSAYPAAVTAQMCRNYASGGAAINAIARAVRADVVAVDIGVDADLDDVAGLVSRKVRRGTRDLSSEPAMTETEGLRAIAVGRQLLHEQEGLPDVVALGEMGIGNTTAASALTAALTGAAIEDVVGRGTGLDASALDRKRQVVTDAVKRITGEKDPLTILFQVGGLEIAGLVGVILGAAAIGRAVVTDGFIATAAVLVAARLCPATLDYVIASHGSTEPGHRVQLAALGLQPLLSLDLRLGEGTGAALALPLLDAAAAILREMATFSSAGVSTRVSPEKG